MFIRKAVPTPSPTPARPAPAPVSAAELPYANPVDNALDALKQEVHARLVDEADAAMFLGDQLVPEAQDMLRRLIQETAQRRDELLTRARLDQLHAELLSEISGLGPLEPLMRDPAVSEIMVNASDQIYVERAGRILATGVRFDSDEHLLRTIDRIVNRVGRHIDEANPMCDARLPDGSRVNAIIPPLALNGPCLTIRRFSHDPLTVDDLIEKESCSDAMAVFLKRCVEAKLNILVSGGTGTGKTTILNVLSSFIPAGERLITIEDAAELQLQQPHVIRLESRQANIEGSGAISTADLLRNTLRMRPDRIIIGEVRGGEALSMLQAMNTGHEGSLTTIHANGCRDALSRLETMVLMAGMDLPHWAIREQVASALDIIIQLERAADGQRRICSVTEIVGREGDVYLMQEIFKYQSTRKNPHGEASGRHVPTGLVPRCQARLEERGLHLPLTYFQGG
jgi:pilus assembly protein CpaF